jgi:regulatory helix-turn-helix LysR family protein
MRNDRVGGPPKVRRVEPPKSSPHYVNYLTIANPVRCYRVAKMETGDARIEQISPAHSKAAQSGRPPPRWNNCNRLASLLRPGGWSGDFIADRIARTRDCVPISSSTSENQVCCFIALCEERSFNRAAICCGLAQSFLARAIHKLERDLGGRIFERRNSNIRLTVLGIWCGQIF